MTREERKNLFTKIEEAKVISFDVFDTLLFRQVNTPETIFELMGQHFGIYNFKKLRMDAQNEASRIAYQKRRAPHANFDDIYECLKNHTEYPVDWDQVKEFELQIETDALLMNPEMRELWPEILKTGKRIVCTTDMYLFAGQIRKLLENAGYTGIQKVYCSADYEKAKFNQELFTAVKDEEGVSYSEILHIGDSRSADTEIPGTLGIRTFLYSPDADTEKLKNSGAGDADNGLYKILYKKDRGFFYNLGVEAGGPIYFALYRWLLEKRKDPEKKLFFLSRDGSNLYRLFLKAGVPNIEYLYTSRRALQIPGITDLSDANLSELPPYTFGQTVGDLFDYLNIDTKEIEGIKEAGFRDFSDRILEKSDFEKVYALYRKNEKVLLDHFAKERENAKKYFERIGLFGSDAYFFDCGWSGTSQYALERLREAIGDPGETEFFYFGILDKKKSHRQLRGRKYDCFLFNSYSNYMLQYPVTEAVGLYEMFFSANQPQLQYYGDEGPVFREDHTDHPEKEELFQGISDYCDFAPGFIDKYQVEVTPKLSAAHLLRVLNSPTAEEAVQIGNMDVEDSFAAEKGKIKRMAYVSDAEFSENPEVEIYWKQGFLKRPDIPEFLKQKVALKYAIEYPEPLLPYHLEDGASIDHYQEYRKMEEENRAPKEKLSYEPKFSVVMPVYNVVDNQLREAVDSVLCQNYENFELILVDDASTWESVRVTMRSYENEPRVKTVYRERNGHISESTNSGIEIAEGEFIVFMDCDDTITEDALYEMAKKLNENRDYDFIYSDNDKVTEDGKIYHMVSFKCEWSPELFNSMMYTNHLAVYRTSITKELGGLRSDFNGSQDYDFTLRFVERIPETHIGYINKVLYHWRERTESVAFSAGSKNYASEAARNAKQAMISRRNMKAHLENIPGMEQYIVVYDLPEEPLVSVIIPSKDHPEILKTCIRSLQRINDYRNLEIIVVDNGSTEENRKEIETIPDIRYLYAKEEFNFSRMCNRGAENARGEFLLFLNDDTEVLKPDSVQRMLGQAMQEKVGCVGAKLFYTDSSHLQHDGISETAERGPCHEFLGTPDSAPCYFGYNWINREVLAVTGACLLIRRSLFFENGAFDETFPVAYNDVELCFRITKAGFRNILRNDAIFYHHESLSRGYDSKDEKKEENRILALHRLYEKYPEYHGKDPYRADALSDYRAVLTTVANTAEIRKWNPGKVRKGGKLYVDFVSVENELFVGGWSCISGKKDNLSYERRLLFRDPFGEVYSAPVTRSRRLNVAQIFSRTDYLYSGYDCHVDLTALPADMIPFEIGMETVADGKRYVSWSGKTTPAGKRNERPLRIGSVPETFFRNRAETVPGEYRIEKTEEKDGFLFVTGSILPEKEAPYRFRVFVEVTSEQGTSYYETVKTERPDILLAKKDRLFLYESGFLCRIPKTELPEKYRLSLRLTEIGTAEFFSPVL